MSHVRIIVTFSLLCIPASQVSAQHQTLLLKQTRNTSPATNLTAAEFAELSDPMFVLVLKDHADVKKLDAIEDLIQPDPAKRRSFVVSETIRAPQRGQGRRAVLDYRGSNPALGAPLDNNLMLSVVFNSEAFPNSPDDGGAGQLRFIEAWGWDNHRGRYNYYKLDRSGTPDSRMTWKFRGSSVGAENLSRFDRRGTCMECHINGAPLMKELLFPWNNWDSSVSPLSYLQTGNAATWPVLADKRLSNGRLRSAADLEGSILAAIRQFNRRRINSALKRRDVDGNVEETDAGGDPISVLRNAQGEFVLANGAVFDGRVFRTVVEGRRLLRHLFQTTEYNIISDRRVSGLHPIAAPLNQGPSANVTIPSSFFLNSNLIGGGGLTEYTGLRNARARQFSAQANAVVKPDEYKTLLANADVRINNRPGDAHFAWIVPEASHVDNDTVDQLLKEGIVTPDFVASVMLIDLETPLFSDERQSLFRFVPDTFRFVVPADDDDLFDFRKFTAHELRAKTAEAIEATTPDASSPAGRFLSLLKTADANRSPVVQLKEATDAYIDRVKQRLASSADRQAELQRLYNKAVDVRLQAIRHPVLRALDETNGRLLFPVP